jgi:hypothetical protein
VASCERELLAFVLVSVNVEVLQLPSSGTFRMTARRFGRSLVRPTTVRPGLKPISSRARFSAGLKAPLPGPKLRGFQPENLGALNEDAGQVLAVVIRQKDPQERYYGGYAQAHRIHEQVIGEDVH